MTIVGRKTNTQQTRGRAEGAVTGEVSPYLLVDVFKVPALAPAAALTSLVTRFDGPLRILGVRQSLLQLCLWWPAFAAEEAQGRRLLLVMLRPCTSRGDYNTHVCTRGVKLLQ